MKNKAAGILIFLILASAACGFYYMENLPPNVEKLTEDPKLFKFSHFHSPDTLIQSLDAILREEMNREEVEELLVESAGANIMPQLGNSYVYYNDAFSADLVCGPMSKGHPSWRIMIKYDQDDKIVKTDHDWRGEEDLYKFIWPCL